LLRLFGFLSLIAIVLAVCSNAWRVPRLDDYLDVAIHADGVVVDGRWVSDDDLDDRLAEFSAEWTRWHKLYGGSDDPVDMSGYRETTVSLGSGHPTVRLAVDGDVPYDNLCQRLSQCNAAGLDEFELQHQGRRCAFVAWILQDYVFFPIRYTSFDEDDDEFLVRIAANPQGNIDQILTESGTCTSPEGLHAFAVKFVSNSSYYQNVPDARARGKIDCDGRLRFDQLAAILAAITTRSRPDGTCAPLIDMLRFVDPQKKAAEIVRRRADRDALLQRIEREGDPRGWLRWDLESIDSFLKRAEPPLR
jgi:hypothetical protein